jgi:beta-1,4-mannosyl-glycoprotein beta-1,4-N-acetylglucosaminyltransferase
MAIYDCFQYFNEDHMLDLRFNILDEKVDYFVISESTKTHQGNSKKLNFNINNFKKYKKKIIYLVDDFENKNLFNHTGGESLVEQHQRNNISNGLKKADDNDLIILSDSDEIPDLDKLKQIKSRTKFSAFSQMMFMYKLNLKNLDESNWIGSKVCLKKNFPLPQKLRDMKFKDYSFW